MKKILITGANGYIGARLSKFLSENGYEATALCYPSAPDDRQWSSTLKRIIVGDIRNESIILELESLNIDSVIHLISLDHNQCAQLPFNDVLSVNVNPTGNLLEKLSKKGLRKFIYFSTIQVYGKVKNELITEEHRTHPANLYGLTHLLSEQICNYYNSTTEIDCISVRLSNSYGSPVFIDNNCWWLVLNDLCKEAFLNNRINLKSDGTPLRDFIHSSDLCKAIKILIDKETKAPLNIYNLSSGLTISILELAFKVSAVYKIRYNKNIDVVLPDNKIPIYYSGFSQREQFSIDNNRISALGFKPTFKIEDGINDLFNYLEKVNAKQ